jgi:hypothetical protein
MDFTDEWRLFNINNKLNTNTMYQILKQFLTNSMVAWVLKLNENDQIFEYENEADAQAKLDELNSNETEGRQYRIVNDSTNLDIVE